MPPYASWNKLNYKNDCMLHSYLKNNVQHILTKEVICFRTFEKNEDNKSHCLQECIFFKAICIAIGPN